MSYGKIIKWFISLIIWPYELESFYYKNIVKIYIDGTLILIKINIKTPNCFILLDESKYNWYDFVYDLNFFLTSETT